MPEPIRLEDVTAANWRAVTRLELSEDQQRFVASNVYSLAQSKFEPEARPRAIYAGDAVVGFIMYDIDVEDGAPEAVIYRFMIDHRHQRKGYGRAALGLVVEELRDIPGLKKISISYLRDNPAAKSFYASFGFVERKGGDDRWGEVHAELVL